MGVSEVLFVNNRHGQPVNGTSRLALLIAADNSSASANAEEAEIVPLGEQIDYLDGSDK